MILSFDVGIKNLAYCLMDRDNIIDWGIINIDLSIKKYCSCNNVAECYYVDKDDNYIYLCKNKCNKPKNIRTKKIINTTCDYIVGLMRELNNNYQRFISGEYNDNKCIVVIENQPSNLNQVMKTMSVSLLLMEC